MSGLTTRGVTLPTAVVPLVKSGLSRYFAEERGTSTSSCLIDFYIMEVPIDMRSYYKVSESSD